MESSKRKISNIALAAMFLAIGFVLPLFTSQIKEIGDTLLPMHIPVMLCGLICGWRYGFSIGLILPFFRSLVFGMPPIYPNAVWMAAELAAYGLVIGLIYSKLNQKNTKGVYISLVSAMIAGRLVWAAAKAALLGLGGKAFTMSMFLLGGFVDAAPGIVLQLVLIPSVMAILSKRKMLK